METQNLELNPGEREVAWCQLEWLSPPGCYVLQDLKLMSTLTETWWILPLVWNGHSRSQVFPIYGNWLGWVPHFWPRPKGKNSTNFSLDPLKNWFSSTWCDYERRGKSEIILASRISTHKEGFLFLKRQYIKAKSLSTFNWKRGSNI